MTYLESWSGLAARIRGLFEVAKFHVELGTSRSSDDLGRGEHLREQVGRIREEIIGFNTSFANVLPPAVGDSVKSFIERTASLMELSRSSAIGRKGPDVLILMLAAFETEVSYLLSDKQESIRSRTDRAFEHLQRLIVVDEDIRRKWKEAFKRGEVACEKLGATHLLAHGIWAFKADAKGERTDLVYPEPFDYDTARRAAEGLVLTEWKKTSFEDARTQAERYGQGILAGFELARYRYAILVSEKHEQTPADLLVGNVTYRHVSIAVDPDTPSKRRR